jgi:hypothetical protein
MDERSKEPRAPQVAFTEREGYLEACFPPGDSVAVALDQGRELVRRCQELKPSRLLIDFSNLKIHPSTLNRYEMGTIASQLAPNVGRAAVVAPPSLIDPEKFGVQVASNRGLPIDIFSDRAAAVAWLTGP